MDKNEKREALRRTVIAAITPDVKATISTYNQDNINDFECFTRLRDTFPGIPSDVIMVAINSVRSELEEALEEARWEALEESVVVKLARSALAMMTKPK